MIPLVTPTNPPAHFGYVRALLASWRFLWPIASFTGGCVALARYFVSNPTYLFLPVVLNFVGLFLFVHRLVSKPYRDFRLSIIRDDGTTATGISLAERWHLGLYFSSRILLASVAAWFLLGPLRILLSLFGIYVEAWIPLATTILGTAPLLVKMSIDHGFTGFHLEVDDLNPSVSG